LTRWPKVSWTCRIKRTHMFEIYKLLYTVSGNRRILVDEATIELKLNTKCISNKVHGKTKTKRANVSAIEGTENAAPSDCLGDKIHASSAEPRIGNSASPIDGI